MLLTEQHIVQKNKSDPCHVSLHFRKLFDSNFTISLKKRNLFSSNLLINWHEKETTQSLLFPALAFYTHMNRVR